MSEKKLLAGESFNFYLMVADNDGGASAGFETAEELAAFLEYLLAALKGSDASVVKAWKEARRQALRVDYLEGEREFPVCH